MRQSASVPVWAIVGMAAAIAIVGLLTAEIVAHYGFSHKGRLSCQPTAGRRNSAGKSGGRADKIRNYTVTPC